MNVSARACTAGVSVHAGVKIRRGWVSTGEASLRYIDAGTGAPIVLLHGGLGDYRSWLPHLSLLAHSHRVIAYSRRYSYGSRCVADETPHDLMTDVADLEAVLASLDASPAHVVGTSYGALIALKLALDRPGRVRTIVLAEPPLHEWLAQEPAGRAAYVRFIADVWRPALEAFDAGQDRLALAALTDGFIGTGGFAQLDHRRQLRLQQNTRAMCVLMRSRNVFCVVTPRAVKTVTSPCLILCGGQTTEVHRLGCRLLAGRVPAACFNTMPTTGHWGPADDPARFAQTVLNFIAAGTPHRRAPARRP